jgi:hypothetical protein
MAGESACPVTAAATPVLSYTASCADKATCGYADFVEAKSPSKEAEPLGRMSLCVGTARGAVPVALPPPEPDKGVPTRFVIGHAVDRALALEEAMPDGPQPLKELLRVAAGASVPVDLTLESGGHVRTVPLRLDLSPLWVRGTLQPRIVEAKCRGDHPCGIGDVMDLTVHHLPSWRIATQGDLTKLLPTFDGVRLVGLRGDYNAPEQKLSFRLDREMAKPDSVASWSEVLARAHRQDGRLKVGLADDKGVVAAGGADVSFRPGVTPGWAAFVLASLAVVVILPAAKQRSRHHWHWLRDASPVPDDRAVSIEMPFSLARLQMACWTIVVLAAFIYIGLFTGDWHNLNETALVLLGLGAGTALGSAVAANPSKEVKAATEAYAATKKDTPERDSARQALIKAAGSNGWFTDISSEDGQRAGLHRIQSLLFTAAMLLWFIADVLVERTMPTFNATELALLGISGGAYVGFKLAKSGG